MSTNESFNEFKKFLQENPKFEYDDGNYQTWLEDKCIEIKIFIFDYKPYIFHFVRIYAIGYGHYLILEEKKSAPGQYHNVMRDEFKRDLLFHILPCEEDAEKLFQEKFIDVYGWQHIPEGYRKIDW